NATFTVVAAPTACGARVRQRRCRNKPRRTARPQAGSVGRSVGTVPPISPTAHLPRKCLLPHLGGGNSAYRLCPWWQQGAPGSSVSRLCTDAPCHRGLDSLRTAP